MRKIAFIAVVALCIIKWDGSPLGTESLSGPNDWLDYLLDPADEPLLQILTCMAIVAIIVRRGSKD